MQNNGNRLFEKAPCGYLITNANADILRVNDLLCEWLDCERQILEGQKNFRDIISVGGKIYYETTHAPIIQLQPTVQELSYYLVTKDKKRLPVLVNTSRFYDSEVDEKNNPEDYKLQFIIFPFFDRKKYEKELLAAKESAEKAAAAKSVFINTVTHELRTPIHSILNAGKLLSHDALSEEQRELTDILQFSAESLLELVTSVLDLSKMEANQLVLLNKPFDLKKLADRSIRSLRAQAEQKGLQLHLHFSDNLPAHFTGDSGKIRQVLANLLANAVKFTEQGKVTLTVSYSSEKNLLHFSVADTGIGIDPSIIEKIFVPFSQANDDIHLNFGGTGLGLSICKRILEAYDSSLHVESTEGKGSVFSFVLHLEKAADLDLASDAVPKNTPIDLSHLNILVTDDVHSNLVIIGRYLKQRNIAYDTAQTGTEALEMIFKKKYDLIFLDIIMPGLSGYEVARKVRENTQPYYQSVPLVALTAFANENLQEKVEESGMNDVLQKPFTEFNLIDIITRYTPSEAVPAALIDFAPLYDLFENDTADIKSYLRAVQNDIAAINQNFIDAENRFDLTLYKSAVHKTQGVLRLLHIDKLQDVLTAGERHLENGEKEKFAESTHLRRSIFPELQTIIKKETEK